MQSVHADKYMVRNLKGKYVKTEDNSGIGYVIFPTKREATEWIEEHGKEDCFVVKVRAALTPVDTGRAERMVAVHKTRPKTLSEKLKNNFFPY